MIPIENEIDIDGLDGETFKSYLTKNKINFKTSIDNKLFIYTFKFNTLKDKNKAFKLSQSIIGVNGKGLIVY